MKTTAHTLTFAAILSLSGAMASDKILDGLTSDDNELVRQAIADASAKGAEFLPTLREWAKSDDPRLNLRARTCIGKITGHWGSETDLVWQRSFDDAVKLAMEKNRPIMLLQLFGKLDEEFC